MPRAGFPPRRAARVPGTVALASLLALTAVSCSPGPRVSAASSGASSSAPGLDALLPAEDGWRAFRLDARRHTLLSPESAAALPPPDAWKMLAAPTGPFRPVQALAGQRGYFHLVDAASGRLCLYDAGAALLSTHPLPEAYVPFAAGRVAVFRGAGGAFTFVDYGSGDAAQFADRQTTASGGTQWVPRGTVRLPAGTRDCIQPPGDVHLYCRIGTDRPVRFDGALNRVPLRNPGDAGESSRAPRASYAIWDAAAREWSIAGTVIGPDGSAVPFRHYPVSRRWVTGTEDGTEGAVPVPSIGP